jgi:hypothetical protein
MHAVPVIVTIHPATFNPELVFKERDGRSRFVETLPK